jgi:glycine cleavage system H protein
VPVSAANCRYSTTHEWARMDGDVLTVGMTRFAIDLLSDMEHLQLPQIGASLRRGQPFGELESRKNICELYAPVSGEVVAVNPRVQQQLSLLQQDPEGDGWLIQVRLIQLDDWQALLPADEYLRHCQAVA